MEIQVWLLKLSPGSSLKEVNFHFYLLYNDLFYDKLIRTFGEDVKTIIAKVYPWLRTYIMSLDAFRFTSRNIIASRLKLTDGIIQHYDESMIAQSMYVSDSWKYVYSLFKNKRLYAEYNDYSIDEPNNYVYDHFVEINRSYLLSYSKTIWLAPGIYNLNIALAIKNGQGLGTTKFEVRCSAGNNDFTVQTFYPPSNINEIFPRREFCFLKVGEFHVPARDTTYPTDIQKLCKVQITMEEIGLFLKSGFRIYFIDISQHSMLFNDFDLLFYSCDEIDYKYFINLPLKNFYKALNYVQNGGVDDFEHSAVYGSGDPHVLDYDYNFQIPTDLGASHPNHIINYAQFYFRNTFRRNFRFNTVYQKRQFINRFGNYEVNERTGVDNCIYDPTGLKWKIPIVGEL